jgi:predicted RNA polymerase sigma factor
MTDEALMAAYREGDFHAFQTLYEKHRGRVMGYLVLKLRDRNDAEDAFQTVFSKLHAGRSTYKDEIPFLPWLIMYGKKIPQKNIFMSARNFSATVPMKTRPLQNPSVRSYRNLPV